MVKVIDENLVRLKGQVIVESLTHPFIIDYYDGYYRFIEEDKIYKTEEVLYSSPNISDVVSYVNSYFNKFTKVL